MPRTRFDKYKKRDLILETIQGRVVCGEVPCEDIANCLGISPRQTYRWLKTPSAKWKYGDLIKVCRLIGISQDEFRELVTF